MRLTSITTTTPDDNSAWPQSAEPYLPDKTLQIVDMSGASFTLSIEGANDHTNWVILHDPQGNVLTFTSVNKIEQIQENSLYIEWHR